MGQTVEGTQAMVKEQEARPQAPQRESDTEGTQDSDISRGRTRARVPRRHKVTANGGGSAESSTFRGRTRWRSTSPFAQVASGNTSPHGGTITPLAGSSAALLLRLALRNRRRSQSPSRSRTPEIKPSRGTRRRTRTSSRRLRDNPLLVVQDGGTGVRMGWATPSRNSPGN